MYNKTTLLCTFLFLDQPLYTVVRYTFFLNRRGYAIKMNSEKVIMFLKNKIIKQWNSLLLLKKEYLFYMYNRPPKVIIERKSVGARTSGCKM